MLWLQIGCVPTQTSTTVTDFCSSHVTLMCFPHALVAGMTVYFKHVVINLHTHAHTHRDVKRQKQGHTNMPIKHSLTICESLLVCTRRCQSKGLFQLINKGEEGRREEGGRQLPSNTYVLQMLANSIQALTP